MRHMLSFFGSLVLMATAQSAPLSAADLSGTWRMSAASSAKYGCDNPGAMTVTFKLDGEGGLTGVYSSPGLTGPFEQSFTPFASMGSVLDERRAGGRAITLEAPKSMRRILAVETASGPDGRPTQLSWASLFGGFGEEPGPFDGFTPSAWLTRCPN